MKEQSPVGRIWKLGQSEHGRLIAAVALTRDKTILMIAHRLKTVRRADQILVVDQGRIVQRGTHEQLIRQPGICADFVGGRRKAEGWKI